MLYDCWKMCVMMGAICSAVSLRTLAGSSSGPVALFWLRFFNCLIMPFVPMSRGGMLEYNEGSITGMGQFHQNGYPRMKKKFNLLDLFSLEHYRRMSICL